MSDPVSPSTQDELDRLRSENFELRTRITSLTRSSNEYLQNVAHQLTAPLNAMKWNIEALRNPDVPLARKSNILSSLYSQATILVYLIKNFALMSNLEADLELGQYEGKDEPIDALRLAINLANDFQPQAAEGEKTIFVDDDSFTRALQGRHILAVKNLIAQALSNFLENAIKYSDLKTTITVSAAMMPANAGFGVSVTSIGMILPRTEVPRLHERGFRGSGAKAKVPAGTGIGLYLANRIMALHRGTIHIASRNHESVFTLVFPLTRLH